MFLYETVLGYPGKMDTRMSQKSNVEKHVKGDKRNTCKQYSAEEKIRIILVGLEVKRLSPRAVGKKKV